MSGQNKSQSTPPVTDLTAAQRDCAHYVADIVLQLGNTARQVELAFLAHLLEMAYYEAFRLANGSEPDFADAERRGQAKETS